MVQMLVMGVVWWYEWLLFQQFFSSDRLRYYEWVGFFCESILFIVWLLSVSGFVFGGYDRYFCGLEQVMLMFQLLVLSLILLSEVMVLVMMSVLWLWVMFVSLGMFGCFMFVEVLVWMNLNMFGWCLLKVFCMFVELSGLFYGVLMWMILLLVCLVIDFMCLLKQLFVGMSIVLFGLMRLLMVVFIDVDLVFEIGIVYLLLVWNVQCMSFCILFMILINDGLRWLMSGVDIVWRMCG